MTFARIPSVLWLQVMMPGWQRSTNLPTVYRKKTVTVPETRAASSHQNVQTVKRRKNSSQTLYILSVGHKFADVKALTKKDKQYYSKCTLIICNFY